MKKIFILCALMACVGTMYGQSAWNVNIDNERLDIVYNNGITISFENLGVKTISLDNGGRELNLCLKNGKLEIKLDKEKLVLGSCDSLRIVDKTSIIQLKSSDGKKCTINIKFPAGGGGGEGGGNIPEDVFRAFYDAKSLRSGTPDDKKKVWKKYNIAIDTQNPFLQGVEKSSRVSGGVTNIKSLGSAIGGLDVTKFADGLAKFLVKRAKEELTIAFFEDFKKELDKHEDIKDLFPNTKATLDLVGEEIYNYERYLVTLRENFESDFEALPDNITKIVENHSVYFETHKELASGIFVGSKVAIGLRDKEHPGDIISALDKTDIGGFEEKVQQSFFIVQTLSEALRDTTTGEKANYWIGKAQFQRMAKDKEWLKYFVGLSLEMIRLKDVNLYNSLIKNTTLEPFTGTINSVITQSSRINTLVAAHKPDEKVGLETIASYVDAVTGLFGAVGDATILLAPNSAASEFVKNKFIPFIKNSNGVVGNISKKNYSSALFNVIELYALVTPESDAALQNFVSTAQPIIDGLKSRDKKKWGHLEIFTFYQDVMRLSDDALNKKYELNDAPTQAKIAELKKAVYPTDKSVIVWLTKYGGFMAAIISAENSDEVAAVIETYALPSGSARIKRQSYFNIAVNSYLGLSMGWDKAHRWAPGVSAPVGVAFSWGTKKGGSFSIFPTLIDIGAVTAFRFKNDTSQVAKIYLREIFSPGLFFSFGIRKLPISLNFGGQFAPLLERVVAGSNDYNIQRNFRLSVSFLVDIPLLNLYNRANKKPVVAKVPKAPKKANANKP